LILGVADGIRRFRRGMISTRSEWASVAANYPLNDILFIVYLFCTN
jgi:hypothetical protein